MKIKKITATEKSIRFESDITADSAHICAYSPATEERVILHKADAAVSGGVFVTDRFCGNTDLLFCRFEVCAEGEPAVGKLYVEDLAFEPDRSFDYPKADTIKGLQVAMVEDAVALGVKHAAQNLCIGDIMCAGSGANMEAFTFNGREYYFNTEHLAETDSAIKRLSDAGITVTLILLNKKHWHYDTAPELCSALLHPGYLKNLGDNEVELSAFNVTTALGLEYYMAFIAFVTERYTREDARYGRAVGLIIGNEITSGWIWGNAGSKTAAEYMREYSVALRAAWQVATSIYKNMRIYISLDHYWTGRYRDEPDKFYGGREILSILVKSEQEGAVGWNVAYHPYPQKLECPDFWNDETATEDENTYRITFKNLHILAEYLYREDMLYKGRRRRIILSEQGFNSAWTEESEVLQAFAYGRAYKTCMGIPEIDSFILHAHCDNAGEFGLNLGLWRREKDGTAPVAKKPIYYVFKAIDKRDESGEYHWERY